MPRKKSIAEPKFDGDVLVDQPETEKPANTPADEETRKARAEKKGVYIPFNEDGSLDEKRLRGETWKVDAARKALGVTPGGAPVSSGMEVSDDFVKGLYKGFEFLLQRVGTMLLKWPQELAAEMHYTDEQKTRLAEPTKKVIEKFAPSWLKQNEEIATLAVVFAAETGEMVQGALRQYVAKHPEMFTAKEPAPVKPNGSEHRHDEGVAA